MNMEVTMLRQGIWIAVILAVFSMLTACPHKEVMERGDSHAPQGEIGAHSGSPEPQVSLEGRWEALEPRSGPANILEFMVDGKATSLVIARIYSHYSIESDKISLTMDFSPGKGQPEMQAETNYQGSEPIIYTYELSGDRLMMTNDATGEIMDMQRDDQETASIPIVGHWSYEHSTGMTARMFFNANGVSVSRVPMSTGLESFYEVRGDVLTVRSLDRRQFQSVKYKLEDRQLVLIDGDKITRYDRVRGTK